MQPVMASCPRETFRGGGGSGSSGRSADCGWPRPLVRHWAFIGTRWARMHRSMFVVRALPDLVLVALNHPCALSYPSALNAFHSVPACNRLAPGFKDQGDGNIESVESRQGFSLGRKCCFLATNPEKLPSSCELLAFCQ